MDNKKHAIILHAWVSSLDGPVQYSLEALLIESVLLEYHSLYMYSVLGNHNVLDVGVPSAVFTVYGVHATSFSSICCSLSIAYDALVIAIL